MARENVLQVQSYFETQREINAEMREVVVDWMTEVGLSLKMTFKHLQFRCKNLSNCRTKLFISACV